MVRDISIDSLKGLMDGGEKFVLVNTLEPEDFEQERICGSINIPAARVAEDAQNLIGKDEHVIVYCSGPGCKASETAGDKLESLGYKNVHRFEGGIEQWKGAGYCMEGRMHERKAA